VPDASPEAARPATGCHPRQPDRAAAPMMMRNGLSTPGKCDEPADVYAEPPIAAEAGGPGTLVQPAGCTAWVRSGSSVSGRVARHCISIHASRAHGGASRSCFAIIRRSIV
jgi:hypothetical protein